MRRICLTLLAASLLSLPLAAQKNVSFGDIPFEASEDVIVRTLMDGGMSVAFSDSSGVFMQGRLGSYDNCYVSVDSYSQDDSSGRVLVYFSPTFTWKELYENYRDIRDGLVKRYGEPEVSRAEFDREVSDDAGRLDAVRDGKCDYYSLFVGPNKHCLFLEITRSSEAEYCVVLTYIDERKSKEFF